MKTFDEVLEKIKKTQMNEIVLKKIPLDSTAIAELFKVLEERNQTVSELSFDGCSIDDGAAITLFELIEKSKNTNLKKIALENNKIHGDAIPQIIETLKGKPNLSILLLGNNGIKPDAINLLSGSFGRNETNLSLIFLNDNPMPEDTKHKLLTAVGKNHTLRSISIANTSLDEADSEKIKEFIKESAALPTLGFSRNNLRQEGMLSVLNGLKENKRIIDLFLSRATAEKREREEIESFLKSNDKLIEIALNSTTNDISVEDLKKPEEDLKNLAESLEKIEKYIKENTRLFALDISRNNLGPSGISSILSGLKENKKITDLFLSRTNPGKQGVANISSFLQSNDTLIQLDLGANDISDEDFKNLAKSLEKNEKLERLSLDRNKITHKSAAAVEKLLKENKILVELNFEKNQLTDAGAKIILRGLRQNTTLQELKLGDNSGISTDTLREIDSILKRNNQFRENTEKLIEEIRGCFDERWINLKPTIDIADNLPLAKIFSFIFTPSKKILERHVFFEKENSEFPEQTRYIIPTFSELFYKDLKSPEKLRYIRLIFSELSYYKKVLFEDYWRWECYSEKNQNNSNVMVSILRLVRNEPPLYERAHLESAIFFASKLSDFFRHFNEEISLDITYFKNIISYLSSAEKYNSIFVSDEERETRTLETLRFYEDLLIKFCRNSYINKNDSVPCETKEFFKKDIMNLIKSCITVLYFSPIQVTLLSEFLLSVYYIVHSELQKTQLDVNADNYHRALTAISQKNILFYPLIETDEDQKKMDEASKNIKRIADKLLQDRRDYESYLTEKEREKKLAAEAVEQKKQAVAEQEKQAAMNAALSRYPFWRPQVPGAIPRFDLLINVFNSLSDSEKTTPPPNPSPTRF